MSEAVQVTQNEIVFPRNNNFVFMSLENTQEIQINLLDGDHQVKKTDNRVNSKSSGLAMHHFSGPANRMEQAADRHLRHGINSTPRFLLLALDQISHCALISSEFHLGPCDEESELELFPRKRFSDLRRPEMYAVMGVRRSDCRFHPDR